MITLNDEIKRNTMHPFKSRAKKAIAPQQAGSIPVGTTLRTTSEKNHPFLKTRMKLPNLKNRSVKHLKFRR